MKKVISLSSIVLVIILTFTFISTALSSQCSPDEARLKLFYNEKENSLDMVLIGSSAVRADFIPTKAYENYGIRSFDSTIDHMPLAATEFMIEEVLKYQTPEVLVIDINGITYCDEATTEEKSRGFVDCLRQGKNKDNAYNSLYKDANWEDELPFIKYHSNYNSLVKCLKFKDLYERYGSNATLLKGYTSNPTNVYKKEQEDLLDPSTITKKQEFNEYELHVTTRVLNYCDQVKDEVKIIFVRMPRLTVLNESEEEIPFINTFADMITARGYEYLDFCSDYANYVDGATDFNDRTHLNIFGAEKFTNYFCELIETKHQFNKEARSEDWNKCVELANEYYKLAKESTLEKERKEFYELDMAKTLKVYGVKVV